MEPDVGGGNILEDNKIPLSSMSSGSLSSVPNPFAAPIFKYTDVASTMDEARLLRAEMAPHGSVVISDHQSAGRGRITGRSWESNAAENLLCTLILRYRGISDIPPALSLRTGVAIAQALEDLYPSIKAHISIKWPNDLLINGRKVGGILTESDGQNVYIGIGLNINQRTFPAQLAGKATSLIIERERLHVDPIEEISVPGRFELLGAILVRIKAALSPAYNWRTYLRLRLYQKGKRVHFINGAPDSDQVIEGILEDIGPGGEILIIPEGQSCALSLVTGELTLHES